VPNSIPEGFFKDNDGNLQQERRGKSQERRLNRKEVADGDRRNRMRRVSDEAFLEKEHHQQIEEALEDFAEEHED
jgi:hypothetical protein